MAVAGHWPPRFADNNAVRYTPARVLLLSTPSWQLLRKNRHIDGRCDAAASRQDRVLSSVGRAAPLQGVGHRFDPCSTHQKPTQAVRIPQRFAPRRTQNPHTSPWRVFCFSGLVGDPPWPLASWSHGRVPERRGVEARLKSALFRKRFMQPDVMCIKGATLAQTK